MDKRFLAIIGVIIVLFIGFLFLRGDGGGGSTTAEPTNHVKGAGTSGVTLLEYGDFQCPACAAYYPAIENLVASYGDQITFQFRHFPLVSIHPNAFGASRAAEAASKQGKFWEMYSKIYQGQTTWQDQSNPNDTFNTYAQQIGLNLEQFKTDFRSSPVGAAINADVKAGNDLGVSSTPTFFLNGELVQTPPTATAEADFRALIDAAIAAQGSSADKE